MSVHLPHVVTHYFVGCGGSQQGSLRGTALDERNNRLLVFSSCMQIKTVCV
jgi:hypothetical protein